MFQKYLSRLTAVSLAAAAAFVLCSCSDDNDPPVASVTLALTAGTPTEYAVAFDITTSGNADRVAYVCAPASEPAPDAETIFASGTQGRPGTQTYRIDNLTPETEYRVAAVAAAGEIRSEVKTLVLRTTAVEYRKIEATTTYGSAYYANLVTKEVGTGQYHLFLGTIPNDDAGNPVGAGVLYRLSLHAAPSTDLSDIRLAPGTYTAAETFAEGTFNPLYSTWVTTDAQGQKLEEGMVAGGEVQVGYAQGEYTITARILSVSEQAVEITWKGPIGWWNMIPGGEGLYARGFYFGKTGYYFTDADDPDSDYWVLQIADKFPGASWAVACSFFAEKCDYKNPVPANGTYRVVASGSTVPGSMLPGIPGPTVEQDMGTFAESVFGNWYMTGGEMTVTVDEGVYTLACNLSDDDGHTFEANYTGQIAIDNCFTPQIEFDVEAAFDRVCGDEGRYYGEEQPGIYMYQFCLADGEIAEWWNPEPATPGEELRFQQVTLYSTTVPTDENAIVLPEGTYTFSEDYADLVCDPYQTCYYYWDAEGFKQEVWFTSGTVLIQHTQEGYHIVLEATGEEGNTVRTTYDGAIPMHNSSGKPLAARKRSSASPVKLLPDFRQAPANERPDIFRHYALR